MLNVYQSNRLEALVTLLANQLVKSSEHHIFSQDVILVQSPGMSQWLKLQLAEQNGIAANLNFPLPSSFIWQLYKAFLPNVPERSPFTKDRMAWKLFRLLPQFLQQESFASVSAYLMQQAAKPSEQSNSESLHELRLFQLCEKIADVYDNYLMYRPEWLEHWQAGMDDLPADVFQDELFGQQWQCQLWRALVKLSETQDEQPFHRANMHNLLLKALNDPALTAKDKLPHKLTVFGISSLPQQQLEVLEAISQHICVDVYWLNPCSQYWGDILSEKTIARINAKQSTSHPLDEHEKLNHFISGNPLLASWGKVGRDFLDKLTNSEAEILDLFIEQDGRKQTYLNKVQSDILKLEFRNSNEPLSAIELMSDLGKQTANPLDDSISIHSCHSPIRELEVLKDKLLTWFEQDDSLRPKDVLVMMPDVEKYAPFISSVFNEFEHKDQQIPFTVSDRGALAENPVLNTFTEILTLPNSRYTLPQLIELLEVPEVAARFELSTEEIKQIKSWLSECHIRWGKDGSHKAQWQLPENDLNTWSYGFKRMLLGFSNNANSTWHDIYSYNDIEGMDSVSLGKLISFFNFLLNVEQTLVEDKTIEEWGNYLQLLLSLLFVEQSKENSVQHFRSLQIIRDAIEGFVLYYENNDFEKAINYRLVHHHFQASLNESGVAQRFLAGKMNFCTLMPMRSVPFKVICILGMNEGEYPRQVDPISFDLVGLNTPRKGDRSRKYDDRYLFLEALVSAKEKLHVSYIGQSLTTNQPMMPSVILSELMDYLQESYIVDKKDPSKSILEMIVMTHKLQPFDNAYYQTCDADSLYKPRDAKWFEVAQGHTEASQQNTEQSQVVKEGSSVDRKIDQVEGGCRQVGSINDPSLNDSLRTDNLEIEFDQLVEFWNHPVKYFYRRVLGIKLEINEQTLEQTEVFEHDALIRYKEAENLLQKQFAGNDLSTNTHNSLRSGAYPIGQWGESLSKRYEADAMALKDRVQSLIPEISQLPPLTLEKTLEYDFEGNIIFLTGGPDKVGNKIFQVRNGKLRSQDLISLWLKQLFASATGTANFALGFGNEDKVACFLPITQQAAHKLIGPWLETFATHLQNEQLLFWHPKPACDWYSAKLKNVSETELQNILLKNLSDGFNRTLADDDYASKHFLGLDSFVPEFFTMSEQLLAPMYQHLILDKANKVVQQLEGAEHE